MADESSCDPCLDPVEADEHPMATEQPSPAIVSDTTQQVTPVSPGLSKEAEVEVNEHLKNYKCPIHANRTECMKLRLTNGRLREELSAELEDIQITFTKSPEALRNKTRGPSKMLPTSFYRTYYETSNTLSSKVSKDTHPKHRERKDLKIAQGNAFQAIGEPKLERDVTKPRIERQLIWNKKCQPSSWISAFNRIDHAERRANFHYANSQRIGHRVSIAQISTAGLVAATLSAKCVTTWKVYTKQILGESMNITVTNQRVDIPIWISQEAIPEDRSPIDADMFKESGAELWVSIMELRNSNLKDLLHGHDSRDMIFAKGHNYEWLALGKIPEKRITRNMPWDGKVLHVRRGTAVVWSTSSPDPWIYDWDKEMWLMDANLFALGQKQAQEEEGLKAARKRGSAGN